MVTAIVIPIIIVYFLWVSYREMNENEAKWLKAGTADEEAAISGTIISITTEKQRFYYHRYVYVQELGIKTETGQIKAKIITPASKGAALQDLRPGQELIAYGSYQSSWFHINRIEVAKRSS